MYLLCSKVLAADSMRPRKLKRHLETTHSEYVNNKPKEFFERKLDESTKQKQTFKGNSCITSIVHSVLQNHEV